MKKFISFLVVAVLIVTCMATTVFAAGSLNVTDATAETGDTVTLSNNPGFATYAAYVSYDASAPELTAITAGDLSAGSFISNVGNNVGSYIGMSNDGIPF